LDLLLQTGPESVCKALKRADWCNHPKKLRNKLYGLSGGAYGTRSSYLSPYVCASVPGQVTDI